MKKYIILIILLVLSFVKIDTFATDACDKLIPQYASFVGKATFASNLRDYPCVSKSNVLGISKAGTLYTVISKVDGWYQIKDDNDKIYRIWDQSIIKTNNPVNKDSPEPVEEEYEKPESTGYQLTFSDKRVVNKFMYKITKVINVKSEDYKDLLVYAIYELMDEYSHLDRLVAILQEIINRLNAVSTKVESTINTSENTYSLENIDLSRVKNTWIERYNDERSDLGKSDYSYDSRLEKTALDWSQISKNRGEITHKRNEGDAYYDYDKITSWFADRGVVCKNIYGVTHTENIGYGFFSCNDSDCTDELIEGIRSTFDFYMSEKNKSYKPHYESIINGYFTKIGLGIELEDRGNGYYKYYLTVHYCTELID